MIGWEKRVLLRHYLEQGMTKAAVAKLLGVIVEQFTTGSRPSSWTGT